MKKIQHAISMKGIPVFIAKHGGRYVFVHGKTVHSTPLRRLDCGDLDWWVSQARSVAEKGALSL
jgi:hypothetical protein